MRRIKIKIKDYRKDYYDLSGKASDIGRQLALAGIAIVWVFKKDIGVSVAVPALLLAAGFGFVVALTLDLLQYAIAALIWGTFVRKHSDASEDDLAEAPSSWTWPAEVLFHLKLIAVLVGYVVVIYYFLTVLKPVG